MHDGEYNDTQFLYIGVATAKISSLLKHNKFLFIKRIFVLMLYTQ